MTLQRPPVAETVLDLIGATPMVRLRRVAPSDGAEIVAKLESLNPGGSVKDRIARAMIEEAECSGALKAGDTIVEPTSGNTGVGLALVAAVKGYRLVLTMPEDMSRERRRLLERFGAEVLLTPAIEGMTGGGVRGGRTGLGAGLFHAAAVSEPLQSGDASAHDGAGDLGRAQR